MKKHHLGTQEAKLIDSYEKKLKAKETYIGKGRKDYSWACLNQRKI